MLCSYSFGETNLKTGNATFTHHLPSTLEHLGNHAIKMNISGGSVNDIYTGIRA